MLDEEREAAHKAALTMLESFHRSGANTFDLTITDAHGKKIRFRQNLLHDDLHRSLPILLDDAARHRHNVIVRPRGSGTQFIQLDDLKKDALQRVESVSFLGLETSPGNYQAWVAMPACDAGGEDFARRLRKGAGADPTASGATRIAGSLNFKDKYAPDFPRVEIAASVPGLRVSKDQLAALGLVAAPERREPNPVRVSLRNASVKKWPSYTRCLQGAPPNHGGTAPDVSRADFTWCMTAIDWGWGIEETAARLMELSTKAKENGEKYTLLTAQNAAAAVERRQGRPRS